MCFPEFKLKLNWPSPDPEQPLLCFLTLNDSTFAGSIDSWYSSTIIEKSDFLKIYWVKFSFLKTQNPTHRNITNMDRSWTVAGFQYFAFSFKNMFTKYHPLWQRVGHQTFCSFIECRAHPEPSDSRLARFCSKKFKLHCRKFVRVIR